jgi:hypothetical protein
MIEKRTSAHLWDFKRLGLLSVIEDQNGPLSGLTLPGMIDEPGSFDGTIISAEDRCRSIAWKEVQPFASGGRLTGKLFAMADVGCLLFLMAPLSTILFPRVAPYRFNGNATLFAFLPLRPHARTVPTDIQRRILRPSPKTICVGQLGGCRCAESGDCRISESSQFLERTCALVIGEMGETRYHYLLFRFASTV